jgi:hypothetical protein
MLPLLKLARSGLEVAIQDAVRHLIEEFKLTPEEAERKNKSGETTIYNRTGHAKLKLRREGLIEQPRHGVFRITCRGRELLANPPAEITRGLLMEWYPGRRSGEERREVKTWIFQGNPDEFDLDGYLASRPGQVPWLVTRYASEIAVGDRVYIWPNQGAQRAVAGVVAEGIVTAAPAMRDEDPAAVPLLADRRPPRERRADACAHAPGQGSGPARGSPGGLVCGGPCTSRPAEHPDANGDELPHHPRARPSA